MKKLLIAVAALAGFGVAYAGDYHHGEELKCQQCHTMHATRQHGFEIKNTDGTIAPLAPTEGTGMFNGGAGFDKLLVGGSTNATCLACHNKGGYDVWGSTASATMAGKRSAGALNADPAATDLAAIDVGFTPGQGATPVLKYVAQMGHSMGSKAVAPGGTFFQNNSTFGFNCGDCHEVHGNAAYRNLGPQYSGIVAFDADSQPTYVVAATVDPTVDVTETADAQYNGSGVFFGFGGGANRMNAYCGKCHGNFHGDTNGYFPDNAFRRHPTGNAVSKYDFATTDGRYTARDAVRAVYTSATTVSPGCLTCHKAHGNARSYGLIHPAEAGANVDLENGDAPGVIDHTGTRTFYNPKTLCTTCHYQGKH
jgi:hypothetical protein